MATLTTKQRERLKRSQFALPQERKLPIHDAAHVRNAIARFALTSFPSLAAMRSAARRVLAAARRHGVDVSPGSFVARVGKARSKGGRGSRRR